MAHSQDKEICEILKEYLSTGDLNLLMNILKTDKIEVDIKTNKEKWLSNGNDNTSGFDRHLKLVSDVKVIFNDYLTK
jgi:hypothetical protein